MTKTWNWNTDRKATLPKDWDKRRRAVIRRDHGKCVMCGKPGTDVDHAGARDDHRLTSLRLLCAPCHRARTLQQATEARRLRGRRRPTEPHPGRIT